MNGRPYKPVLVVSPQATDLPPGYTFALRVGPDVDVSALPRWINGNAPFLLFLDGADATEALGLCLFSPHYLRIGGKPVVAGPADVSLLKENGWGDFLHWATPLFITSDAAADFYNDTKRIGSYIFFEDLAQETAFRESCARALERMGVSPGSEGEVLLFSILSAYTDALARVTEAEEAQRVTADRLKSAEVIVSVTRTKYKEDYDTLYNWHHSQYTVLPLWYKRVGQVIKVLTGKRTPRSLFRK